MLAKLHRLGLQTVMLNGDNHPPPRPWARELAHLEQLPALADKAAAIAGPSTRPHRSGGRRR